MRPKTVTVVDGNSPYYIPVNFRGGDIGITATPAGSGDYDVAYTRESIAEGASGVTSWTDITGMSAATAAAVATVTAATCLRITLNSGDSVTVDVAQSDV